MGKSIASRFENIDVTRSVLRAVIINDDELTLEMDFCLEPAHPDYETPGAGDDCCFHPGLLKFAGISKLGLERFAFFRPRSLVASCSVASGGSITQVRGPARARDKELQASRPDRRG